MPQVVLPAWVDLYDYATRAEHLGVGVWGNKLAAPDWTADELSQAFLRVVGDSSEAQEIRSKAEKLGAMFDTESGSVCAAHELAALAVVSKTS